MRSTKRQDLHVAHRCCSGPAALALLLASTGTAVAQEAPPPPLSFQAALARLDKASPGLSGDDHAVRASEEIAAATRTLRRPVVTASASVIEYQKTLSVDLSEPKADALSATNGFLDQLGGQFSGVNLGGVFGIFENVRRILMDRRDAGPRFRVGPGPRMDGARLESEFMRAVGLFAVVGHGCVTVSAVWMR